ncbi:MAG: hypothetical protein AB1498_10225 [bacterium]
MKNLLFAKKILLTAVIMLTTYTYSNATPLPIFSTSNGWTQFANDDGYRTTDGYVNPGWGAQSFDAEHLFYKFQDNILSIGLQTGFDLIDGNVYTGGINYYAGDIALSFDGNSSNYEYAVDFGLFTKDYVTPSPVGGNTGTPGIDSAGVYSVSLWNNDVYGPYGSSKPFAMQSGTLLEQLSGNSSGSGSSGTSSSGGYFYGGYSYYRIVSVNTFYLPVIIPGNPIQLNAHWTMSCGNDAINGSVTIPNPIPEPDTMFLLGSLATGLFGLAGICKKRI